jgi:hypothetical protein
MIIISIENRKCDNANGINNIFFIILFCQSLYQWRYNQPIPIGIPTLPILLLKNCRKPNNHRESTAPGKPTSLNGSDHDKILITILIYIFVHWNSGTEKWFSIPKEK